AERNAALATGRRGGRLSDLRTDHEEQGDVEGAPRLLQHLHPQGTIAGRQPRPEARVSVRRAEGGERLATPELHHLSLLHPAALLLLRVDAGHPLGAAAQWRPGHQLDDGVRAAPSPLPPPLSHDRTHLCPDGAPLPHGGRPHPRSAAQVRRVGSRRVRVRLDLVWLAAVADRRALALPDPRRDAETLGLSRAHRGRQAEDSRPQLCAPLRLVWRTCGAGRRLSPGAQDLRVAHPRLAQEGDGVSRLRCGQHLAGAKGVLGDGSSPESYALRLGAKGVDKRGLRINTRKGEIMATPIRTRKISHVLLHVSDIERSVKFYTDILGFKES